MHWVPSNTGQSTGYFTNRIFNLHDNLAVGHPIYWFSTESPQIHAHSEPVNVILFWNVASADITKLHWVGVGDNLKNAILTRNGEPGHTDMQSHKEISWEQRQDPRRCTPCSVQGTERQGLPATTRSQKRQGHPFLERTEGQALATPSFWLLKSKTVREYIFVVLSHPVCGSLYHSPRKLTAW